MWLVLINPAAGPRPVSADRVERALASAGVQADVEVSPTAEAMRKRIVEASRRASPQPRRIAVVGGDGTANLAVNAILDSEWVEPPVLGLLPGGTGCDLLRTFAIPQQLEAAARHLAGDASYSVYVGRLEGDFGIRHFLNVAQVGVGAAAVEAGRHLSRRLGKARYPLAFLRKLPGFPPAQISLTGDSPSGSTAAARGYHGRGLAVIVANGQFFAGGWNVAPRANLTDGKLDVQVIDCAKPAAFRLVPKIIRGVHMSDPAVHRMSKATIALATEPSWPLEADGDMVGNTPVSISVLPGALKLKI